MRTLASLTDKQLAIFNRLDGARFVPENFSCDGCTCSPDYFPFTKPMRWLFGDERVVPIFLACIIHDYEYPGTPNPDTGLDEWGHPPGTETDRLAADQRLYRNMVALEMLMPRAFESMSRRQLLVYRAYCRLVYRRVRLWGLDAYTFARGHKPSGFKVRAALFVNRYALLGEQSDAAG